MSPARPRSRLSTLLLSGGLLFLGALGARAAAPSAPTVTASAPGISSITWVWTQSPTATGYRVLSSTGGGNISGDLATTISSFTLTSLAKNTSAAVVIEAFNPDGTGDAPLSAAYTRAAPPTGTTILGSSFGQVLLSWNGNGNTSTTTYNVSWYTLGSSTVIFSTQAVSATLSNLTGNATVFFSIRALNGDGLASDFDVTVSTFFAAQPTRPVLTATALGVSSITWTWTASPEATGYRLYTTTDVPVSGTLAAGTLSFNQTGLSSNTAVSLYVQATSPTSSINSLPVTRYTLAGPTTGLTLLGLTIGSNGNSERVSWGPNGNPAGTNYSVQWWTAATSTVAVSTGATIAFANNIFSGSTVYFTVQARNGDGIAANFDATLYVLAPSTYVAAAAQALAAGGPAVANIVLPTGLATVQVASQTFTGGVTLSVSIPAANTVPAAGAGFEALAVPVNLAVVATDAFGAFQQPLKPVAITVSYGTLVNIAPERLVLARYDAVRGAWVALATSRNPSAGQLTAFTEHFSLFAVLAAAPPGDLSLVSIGPNPLRPMRDPGQVMTFRNLPALARVRIYTHVGESLAELAADGAGVASWDGRNKSGKWVASGVYTVLIESGGAKRIKHVAIER